MRQELKTSVSVWPTKFAELLEAPNSEELIAEYACECSIPQIGAIDPQASIYFGLEHKGAMQCFAASQDGQIVGFANVLMSTVPHYGQRMATVESFFVASAHRKTDAGAQLMAIMESYAHDMGCVGIFYSAPVDGRLERLLEAKKSYYRTNAIFFKAFFDQTCEDCGE